MQIGALKSLTIDIGSEVREHNRLLQETDNLFDTVQGGLSNAMGKVRIEEYSIFSFPIIVFLSSHRSEDFCRAATDTTCSTYSPSASSSSSSSGSSSEVIQFKLPFQSILSAPSSEYFCYSDI